MSCIRTKVGIPDKEVARRILGIQIHCNIDRVSAAATGLGFTASVHSTRTKQQYILHCSVTCTFSIELGTTLLIFVPKLIAHKKNQGGRGNTESAVRSIVVANRESESAPESSAVADIRARIARRSTNMETDNTDENLDHPSTVQEANDDESFNESFKSCI